MVVLISAVLLALQVLWYILIAAFILSWIEFFQRSNPRGGFRMNMGNPIIRFIESVSYTVLHPIRRVIDPYQRPTGMDFSPMVALLLIQIVRSVLLGLPVGP